MSKRIEELVKQAKNGDSAAFGELYSENSEKLLKYIKSMNVKQADAEDIMSETFMDAMTHIGDLKNDEAFSSWLFTIAKRKVYAQTKDNAKRVDAVISEDSAYSDGVSELADRTAYENEDIYGNTVMLPSDYAENEEIRGLVVETINSLSEEQRTVVYGYYYDGKNSLELADELGISENTVRSRLKYAKQHIEKKLRKLQESGVVLSVVPIGKLLTIAEEGVKKKAAIAAGSAAAASATVGSGAKVAAVVVSLAAAVGIGIGVVKFGSLQGDKGLKDSLTDSSTSETVTTTGTTTTTPAPEESKEESLPDSSADEIPTTTQKPVTTAGTRASSSQTTPATEAAAPMGTQPTQATQPAATQPVATQPEPAESEPDNPYGEALASGNCGVPQYEDGGIYQGTDENAKWTFYDDGTLVISGSGSICIPFYDSSLNSCYYNADRTVSYDDKIKKMVIEDGITRLDAKEKPSFPNLESVEMADSVIYISGFFNFDKNLKDIKFSKNLKVIDVNAVYGTKWLEDRQKENPCVVVNGILIDCTEVKESSFTVPANVKTIAPMAFSDSKITELTISSTIEKMEETLIGAFEGSSIKKVTVKNGIKTLDDYAFSCCSKLTEVILPDSLTSIGDYAFYNCTSLKTIIIPQGVTSIGNSVFSRCTSLQTITIPASVTTINDYAFYDCDNFTIKTTKGSYAESYAKKWNINVEYI